MMIIQSGEVDMFAHVANLSILIYRTKLNWNEWKDWNWKKRIGLRWKNNEEMKRKMEGQLLKHVNINKKQIIIIKRRLEAGEIRTQN